MDIHFFETPDGHEYRFVWVMAYSAQRARLECLYLHGYKPRRSIACVPWWKAQAVWDRLASHRGRKGLPIPSREMLKMSTIGWTRTRPPVTDGRRNRK